MLTLSRFRKSIFGNRRGRLYDLIPTLREGRFGGFISGGCIGRIPDDHEFLLNGKMLSAPCRQVLSGQDIHPPTESFAADVDTPRRWASTERDFTRGVRGKVSLSLRPHGIHGLGEYSELGTLDHTYADSIYSVLPGGSTKWSAISTTRRS